jgi:hypothetical protein
MDFKWAAALASRHSKQVHTKMPMFYSDQSRRSAPAIRSRQPSFRAGGRVQSNRRQRRARVTRVLNGAAVAGSLILVALIFVIS